MRKHSIVAFLIVISVSRIVSAAEIKFKIQAEEPRESSSQKSPTPFTLSVANRVWTVKGIEQRCESVHASVLETWNSRLICVHAPQVSPPQLPAAPYWIDGVLWPRTKEIFHYRDETPAEQQTTIRFLGPATHKDKFYIGPAVGDRFYVEANCP